MFNCIPGDCSGFESELAIAVDDVSTLFACFGVAKAALAAADFLAGGVLFTAAGLGESAFRVLMLE